MNYEDVEVLLKIDNINKKKSGRGVFNRASRLGYCRGGIKFPSDYLSNKEKKKLNGKVKVYNMYQDIKNVPTKEELMKMNKEKALAILLEARKYHLQKDLLPQIGVSTGSLYTLYDHFGVPYAKYGSVLPKDKRKTRGTISEEVKVVEEVKEAQNKTFEIKLNGTYTQEELEKKLNGICTILGDKEYYVELIVKEV